MLCRMLQIYEHASQPIRGYQTCRGSGFILVKAGLDKERNMFILGITGDTRELEEAMESRAWLEKRTRRKLVALGRW